MANISEGGIEIQKSRASKSRGLRYAFVLAALFAVTGLWVFRAVLFEENFHAVIPNAIYRSAQPSPGTLERRIRELGLRSVINLRGDEDKGSRFEAEKAVIESHRGDFHVIRLTVFMPPRATLRQLVHLLDTAKRPLLLHCAAGVERSGFASAIAVLLSGRDLAEARKQFGLTYGFVPVICRPDLRNVLNNYEHWLTGRGWSHTPDRFRRWTENDYVPYFYRARLEPLDMPAWVARGSRAVLRFRAINTSLQPWRFLPEHDRGVHLGAKVRLLEPSAGQEVELRGGFLNLTVGPGEAVVLELEVPSFFESGRYQFFVDLVDERVKWFSEMGSNPITFELRVEDLAPPSGKREKGHP
jgi:protein tyrosine phosphatase (PTP) superfamily phosphohydrolase (DUF442 family)